MSLKAARLETLEEKLESLSERQLEESKIKASKKPAKNKIKK